MANEPKHSRVVLVLTSAVSLQLVLLFPGLHWQGRAANMHETAVTSVSGDQQHAESNRRRKGGLVTEDQAIESARDYARRRKLPIEGYGVKAEVVRSRWHVWFTPSDPDAIGGGFLIVIDRRTGKIVKSYRGQ